MSRAHNALHVQIHLKVIMGVHRRGNQSLSMVARMRQFRCSLALAKVVSRCRWGSRGGTMLSRAEMVRPCCEHSELASVKIPG